MNALHTLNNDDLTINERLIPDELGTDGGDLILGGTDDTIHHITPTPFILAPLATNATESASGIPTSDPPRLPSVHHHCDFSTRTHDLYQDMDDLP